MQSALMLSAVSPHLTSRSPVAGVSLRPLIKALLEVKHDLEGFFYTLFLFTYTDYKTIFFPISIFAAVAAPVHSWSHLARALVWIWFHLLQCNVSNQYKSAAEDVLNRPWRPLPSGRISMAQATLLRWGLFALCCMLSMSYGWDVLSVSVSLTMVMVLYDEFHLAGHWLGKNFMNIGGYVTFEIGATKIMGHSTTLDNTATLSLSLSAMIIFTMIQMQDFPDVAGDAALGRDTIPIHFPKASRVFTALGSLLWTAILLVVWELGLFASTPLVALGAWIAWRNYNLRSMQADARTYLIFNVWLFTAHLLPLNARTGILAW